MKFQNRYEAGRLLAEKLKHYANNKNVIVLALPRGGVPVAYPIAQKLKAPMDLCLVKKLGVPSQEELAMGAIAMNGEPVLNEEIIAQCGISHEDLQQIIMQKQHDILARNKLYRHNKPAPNVKNKIVIMIDDGIATGATMRAAIVTIKNQHPAKIIIAVPVAVKEVCDVLNHLVDEVICLYQPPDLMSVGYWYENFEQITDEEVIALMTH